MITFYNRKRSKLKSAKGKAPGIKSKRNRAKLPMPPPSIPHRRHLILLTYLSKWHQQCSQPGELSWALGAKVLERIHQCCRQCLHDWSHLSHFRLLPEKNKLINYSHIIVMVIWSKGQKVAWSPSMPSNLSRQNIPSTQNTCYLQMPKVWHLDLLSTILIKCSLIWKKGKK